MKIFQTYLLLFLAACSLSAQIITTDPAIPLENNSLTITFDATEGTGGLIGYTEDVYAHTGVITDKSTSGSDWKYVKTNWGQNTAETKLTRIGNDLYELELGPSISQYYGVPGNETILQLAFVFRSADSQFEGKDDGGTDIFIDVFTEAEGLIVRFDRPDDNTIIDEGQSIDFSVSSSSEADIELFINDIMVAQETGKNLEYNHQFNEQGNYWIVALANNGIEYTEDTIFVCVKEDVINESMPDNLKHGANHIDENTVILVLWAPFKEYVFALGDFNEWRPMNEYQMKKDGDYFWLEIDNLWSGYPYVYQYFIDGLLLLADPYTDQVSDPNNDEYIPEAVYPNLVKYPYQQTYGLASVFTPGEIEFSWEVNDFTPVEKEKLVIYELLIRDFDERHSYKAVMERLDYLQTLGVNALELMPVNEFRGNSSWGYNPTFYFAPDKYYGPKNDLKKLIDECHKRGIAVIIDIVLNHSSDLSPFVQMYHDGEKPAANNPWHNVDHNFTNPDAHWGNDINHESLATQELVDSINAYWMSEYKVDGFRFDFTKGFGNNIKNSSDTWGSKYDADRIRLLKRMSDEVWERNPNAIVIFEHLSDNSEEKELANYGILLWGNMNHDYAEAAMGYYSSLGWGYYKARGWDEPNLVTYMESHDEERIMYKIGEYGNSSGNYSTKDVINASHRIGLNSLFFLLFPGPKMIWQFGELGYDISIDYDCRVCEKPILWNYFEEWQRKNIYDLMTNLNHLKVSRDIFSQGEIIINSVSGPVKYVQMELNGEYAIVLGNFDVVKKNTNVVFPQLGTWNEFFGKNTLDISQTNTQLSLEPGEYKLYSTEELDWKVDMSPVGIFEMGEHLAFEEMVLFPNPAASFVSWNIDLDELQVYDLNGKLIIHEKVAASEKELSIHHLNSGIYTILAIDQEGNYRYGKLIKE